MIKKHPRTYHAPFSNVENDSKYADMSTIENSHVVVTLKMDGENASITKTKTYARSLDSNNHPSRNWIKGFASKFQFLLNEDERIVGENLYATHSIAYNKLKSYFYGFMHWKGDICSGWLETLTVFQKYGINPVDVLYIGPYDEKKVKNIYDSLDFEIHEGIVIRNVNSFHYDDFHLNVVKAVRPNHVKSDKHWLLKWKKNRLM